MHLIVLSCKRASYLIEKSNGKPLSMIDKMQLAWHLSLCAKCTLYKKQSSYLETILKQNQINPTNLKAFKLADPSKERIKKVMEEEMAK